MLWNSCVHALYMISGVNRKFSHSTYVDVQNIGSKIFFLRYTGILKKSRKFEHQTEKSLL